MQQEFRAPNRDWSAGMHVWAAFGGVAGTHLDFTFDLNFPFVAFNVEINIYTAARERYSAL